MPAGRDRVVVRDDSLAGERLHDRAGEDVGHLDDFVPGVAGAGPDEHRHLPAGVQGVGRRPEVGIRRYAGRLEIDGGRRLHDGRCRRPVRVRAGLGHLHVGRDGEVSDAAPGEGMPDGQVDEGRHLHGHVDHLVVLGDIHEEAIEAHLLLVARPEHLGLLHPGDGKHRDMVELRVVEPVQEVDGARPGRGEAHTEPAGRFGIAGRHEGGRLLVVHEDEADAVLVAP